jgi:hypothetical protein
LALELVNDGVLDDSKKLNKKVRDALREKIESEALAWAVCHISPQEIDRINILQASIKAMREATKQLRTFPDFMLIDGNRFVSEKGLPPHECFVKGDGRAACATSTIRMGDQCRVSHQRPPIGHCTAGDYKSPPEIIPSIVRPNVTNGCTLNC